MRITDFLGDYLVDVRRVVEWHAGSLSVEQYLTVGDGIVYEVRVPGSDTLEDVAGKPGVLLIGIMGPDPEKHGPDDHAYEVLRALGTGSRCALLFGFPTSTLPIHRLLDELGAVGGQLLQLSSLDYDALHSAAMIAGPSERIAVPRDPFGEPLGGDGTGGGPDDRALLRLANEHVLLDFAARHHRAELFRLTQRNPPAPVAGTSAGVAPGAVPGVASLAGAWPVTDRMAAGALQADVQSARAIADQALGEAQKLETRLHAAAAEEARLREEISYLEAEVERLERSTSYRLGRLVVDTARRPTRVRSIPAELVTLWRQRGTAPGRPNRRPPVRTPAPAATPDTTPPSMSPPAASAAVTNERRFLAYTALAVAPRVRPVIGAVLTEPTAAALEPHAVVNRLGPNDARLLVERTEPDILLVEAAALGPGHPWAFGSDPAGLERTRLLADLVDQVHAVGRAAVLARDRRSVLAAGLVPIEGRFDIVLDSEADGDEGGWSRGVQLGLFNPIAPGRREQAPIFVGTADRRAPVPQRRFTELVLARLAERGLEHWIPAEDPDDRAPAPPLGVTAGRIRWRDTPHLFRARAVAVACPVTLPDDHRTIHPRTLEQLACGTGVVSGPNPGLEAALGDHVRFVHDAAALADAATGAAEARPASPAALRPLLRRLLEHHSSASMLSRITARLASVADPLAGRSVTVVASVTDAAQWQRVGESLVAQAHRPHQVILLAGEPEEPEVAVNALTAAGIPTGLLPRDEVLTWADVASLAAGEWVSLWPADGSPSSCYLLDLVIGAEMAGGDGVVYDEGDGYRYVPGPDPGRGIVRRSSVQFAFGATPVPVRAGSPAPWSGSGGRWLAIGPEDGA